MKIYSNLPDRILNKGITFVRYSGSLQEKKDILQHVKLSKLRYRLVRVLHRNLRHKEDLHNKPYKPHEFIYIESK